LRDRVDGFYNDNLERIENVGGAGSFGFDLSASNNVFWKHDWYFYTLPDQLTLLADQVYVADYWMWSVSEGQVITSSP
jgi:hypothetical protein